MLLIIFMVTAPMMQAGITVKLPSAETRSNPSTGGLVLSLTNMTTMRFDALGVSVDGFKEKVKALQDTGRSAEEAFREALLQQAEAQLTKVGHAADTTAGQFMQLEAAWKNFTDSMKAGAAEAFTRPGGNKRPDQRIAGI